MKKSFLWKDLLWRLIWIWLTGQVFLISLLILQTTGIGNANPIYIRRIWQWFSSSSLPLTMVLFILPIIRISQNKVIGRIISWLLTVLLLIYVLVLLGRPIYAAVVMPDAEHAKDLFRFPDWSSIIGQAIILFLLIGLYFSESYTSTLRTLPVVVFAFANSSKKHLPLLKEESKLIMKSFGSLHDKGVIELYREESATVQTLIDIFNRFNQRIWIFHFGGHAGKNELITETGTAYANGIAELLRQQNRTIVLVFLNGCSTLKQVDRLLELGIRAVIATSVDIEDRRATEFAGWFYQSLIGGQTLQAAFTFASASLQTKYSHEESPAIIKYRGIGLQKTKTSKHTWGLYIHSNAKELLKWRIEQLK